MYELIYTKNCCSSAGACAQPARLCFAVLHTLSCITTAPARIQFASTLCVHKPLKIFLLCLQEHSYAAKDVPDFSKPEEDPQLHLAESPEVGLILQNYLMQMSFYCLFIYFKQKKQVNLSCPLFRLTHHK